MGVPGLVTACLPCKVAHFNVKKKAVQIHIENILFADVKYTQHGDS